MGCAIGHGNQSVRRSNHRPRCTARDRYRVAARQGDYVDRSRVTVTKYLGDWLDAHALEIKPATLSTYRYLVTHYVNPHIGRMRLQAVRPTTLSGLYRDLLVHGGKEGRPLSRATVDYVHAILRKAFNDAVRSEQLLVTNPAERAKRPRGGPRGLREIWSAEQLRTFLNAASQHRLSAFFRVAAYTGARRGEVSNLRWADIDWDAPALRIKGSVGIIAGQRVEGTTKSGRERLVSPWTLGPSTFCVPFAANRLRISWLSAMSGPRPAMCSPRATGCRSTPTA